MSAMRKAEISGLFSRWLKRFTPPYSIKDDATAQQDEVNSLLAVLLKFAPQNDVGPWVNRAFDALEYQMKSRVWPTKGEVGAVCSNLRKEGFAPTGEGPDMRPEAINARRMQRGEPVSEDYLYGHAACELIAQRMVDQETMERYRKGAFMARFDVYGKDAAQAWEAEAKEKHSKAKADHAERKASIRPQTYTPKRMDAAE